MSTDILPFYFQDHPVRVLDLDGEPWFVAADIANVLGYSAASAMARSLDESEKGVHSLHTLGGHQDLTVISEPGLYEAIFNSRRPEAKKFKTWVKAEVLPQIRKTGSYGQVETLSGPALIAAAWEQIQADLEAEKLRNRMLTPKADAFDGFLSATGDYSLNEGAKLLARNGVKDMGQNRLRDHLLRWGWLYRGRKERLRAHQSAIDAGRMCERTSWYYDDHTGERKTGQTQAVITAKGLFDVKKKLASEDGYLVSADDNPTGGAA